MSIPVTGLKALYSMIPNEGTFTLRDEANENDIAASGIGLLFEGPFGRAIRCDGDSNATVNIAGTGTNELTAAITFRTDDNENPMLTQRGHYPGFSGNRHCRGLLTRDNSAAFFCRDNSGQWHDIRGTSTVTDNMWHRVVLRQLGGLISLWVDGNKEAEADIGSSANFFDYWALGRFTDGPKGNCDLAWWRVYNVAKTDAECAALSNEISPAVKGTVTQNGLPVQSELIVIDPETKAVTGKGMSDISGEYEIAIPAINDVYIAALGMPGYRPQMHGPVIPEQRSI